MMKAWRRPRAGEADAETGGPTIDLTMDGERSTSVDALAECLSGELGRLRGEIDERDGDLVRALERVADSYEHVATQLEDNRRVQCLLAEGLVRLERRLAAIERGRPARELSPSGQRVIGGTITPPAELLPRGDDRGRESGP